MGGRRILRRDADAAVGGARTIHEARVGRSGWHDGRRRRLTRRYRQRRRHRRHDLDCQPELAAADGDRRAPGRHRRSDAAPWRRQDSDAPDCRCVRVPFAARQGGAAGDGRAARGDADGVAAHDRVRQRACRAVSAGAGRPPRDPVRSSGEPGAIQRADRGDVRRRRADVRRGRPARDPVEPDPRNARGPRRADRLCQRTRQAGNPASPPDARPACRGRRADESRGAVAGTRYTSASPRRACQGCTRRTTGARLDGQRRPRAAADAKDSCRGGRPGPGRLGASGAPGSADRARPGRRARRRGDGAGHTGWRGIAASPSGPCGARRCSSGRRGTSRGEEDNTRQRDTITSGTIDTAAAAQFFHWWIHALTSSARHREISRPARGLYGSSSSS